MENTIGNIISRVRKQIKALNKDAFVTDRFLYSLITKHAAWLIRREDGQNKLTRVHNYFEVIEFVELVEVDKISAGCNGIKSNCTIMRTEHKIPEVFTGYVGPLIRSITSIDGSEELQPTTMTDFIRIANSKNFKYNKTKYFWFKDGHLYFPTIDWEAVRIEAMWSGDISYYKHDSVFKPRQHQSFTVPEYLHAEIESHVLRDDLLVMYQIPSDPTHDKQNPAR